MTINVEEAWAKVESDAARFSDLNKNPMDNKPTQALNVALADLNNRVKQLEVSAAGLQ